MTRLGVFITAEELESVKVEQSCSGMFLSGGERMGDPQRAVMDLIKKYALPDNCGLDLNDGEFVQP